MLTSRFSTTAWWRRRGPILVLLLAGSVLMRWPSLAQTQEPSEPSPSVSHTVGSLPTAVPQDRTGLAQRTPSRDVRQVPISISPDIVLGILRQQPGLVLEIKKILIKKAYDQGRILYEEELTDDELFSLISNDARIRAIATREIEARGYLNLRPTREEMDQLEREKLAKEVERERMIKQATQAPAEVPAGEQPAVPKRNIPRPPSQPEMPETPDRVYLNAAELEAGSDSMTRIAPGDLGSLLSASDQSGVGGGSRSQVGTGPSALLPLPWDNDVMPPRERKTNAARLNVPSATPPRSPAQSAIRRRPNPYADVPSLYDLYAQVTARAPVLERFGMDIFRNGTGNFEDLPMDLPAGPEYVLGPGDGLRINLTGGISQRVQRVVDREGRISLPEAGAIQVAGRSLGDVQREVQAVLRTQFRDVQADISLARLRTVRIYVVGDVQNPGPYDISALSTPLNAIYTAGGPTSQGSIRTVRHYRGKQLVQEVDIYDLILHGVRSDVQAFRSGDTVLVPPLGPEVTVEGMVRRPAIYELRGEQNLAEVLEMAGGVLSTGTLRHIEVERVQAHQSRTMLSLDIPENNNQQAVTKALEDFKVQDGDKIRLAPIVAYSDKTVYLEGHVFRPGKYAYHDGMRLTDLIPSYDALLPEPSRRHAEIIRLNAPDYTPMVLAFNLGAALDGKGEAPVLKPFDTVRIFGRYDFEDQPVITVNGEVREPGEHLTNGETHLRDAIYLAGGLTPDAMLDDVQIYRHVNGNELKVISANLEKALSGDSVNNVLVEPKDRVIVHRDLAKLDPPTVTIRGEVANPGRYPLGDDMTASQLVRLAGGLKRSAYTQSADLARYVVENGKKILGEHQEVAIGQALAGVADTDVRLFDGDMLSIRQLSGWNDIGSSVSVAGEVAHPGSYGIHEGERLSSVLERAGGLRASAYPYGAVLERTQVRDIAEHSRQELIRRLENVQTFGAANVGTAPGGDQALVAAAAAQQRQQVLASLKSQPPSGRMVVQISTDIQRWKGTAADIEVRAGDSIFIPKRPNFILVTGQVNGSSAITYSPGKNAGWYLQQAGGTTGLANKKGIFIIRADGSTAGAGGSGLWKGNALSMRLQPGDTVVVPSKIIGGSMFWKNMLNTAQIVSSLAIAAGVVHSF